MGAMSGEMVNWFSVFAANADGGGIEHYVLL